MRERAYQGTDLLCWPPERGAPVEPSVILAAATEKDRVAGSLLARKAGLASWRNIVGYCGKAISGPALLNWKRKKKRDEDRECLAYLEVGFAGLFGRWTSKLACGCFSCCFPAGPKRD